MLLVLIGVAAGFTALTIDRIIESGGGAFPYSFGERGRRRFVVVTRIVACITVLGVVYGLIVELSS